MIAELRGTRRYYSLDNLCAAFGYTRQAWYNQLKRTRLRVLRQHTVLQRIREIRGELPRTGCIKLHRELNGGFLKALGISMGRDAVFALLREHGMLIRARKRYVRTTDSFHRYRTYPDLVQRKPASRAEEIWVSDITYLSTLGGFVYLSLVTDAYSRKILGYCLSKDLKAEGCMEALEMALLARAYPGRNLIHHSDRGTQYCSGQYVSTLAGNGIGISMTQSGSPYDNAIAERVNGILKDEFDLYRTFKSHRHACVAVERAILSYNCLRLHTSCNYRTPEETHMKEKNNQDTKTSAYVNKQQE